MVAPSSRAPNGARPALLTRAQSLALYAASVVVYADMYITQPVLPILSREFGVPPATAGLSVSAVMLAIALASSLYGPLGDRAGRKRLMAGASALLAVPTLLCAFAPSFEWLLVLRALQGVLIPGITAVAVAYVGEHSDARSLGTGVAGLIAASVLGGLLGRVVSGLVADAFSWRDPFLLFGGLTVFGALAMGTLLPSGARQPPVPWMSAYLDMGGHFRDRRLLGAFIIGGALFFGFIGVFTYLPYYLTGGPFNLPTGIVSSAYLTYIAGVVASPLAGRLSARVARRVLMGVGLLIAIAGVLGTLAPSLLLIAASLLVLCVGMFTAQAVAPAFVNATARHAPGSANALYLAFYYVGATLGSVLPGLAWQSFGWSGVAAACTTALLVALVADVWLCRD